MVNTVANRNNLQHHRRLSRRLLARELYHPTRLPAQPNRDLPSEQDRQPHHRQRNLRQRDTNRHPRPVCVHADGQQLRREHQGWRMGCHDVSARLALQQGEPRSSTAAFSHPGALPAPAQQRCQGRDRIGSDGERGADWGRDLVLVREGEGADDNGGCSCWKCGWERCGYTACREGEIRDESVDQGREVRDAGDQRRHSTVTGLGGRGASSQLVAIGCKMIGREDDCCFKGIDLGFGTTFVFLAIYLSTLPGSVLFGA
jgi:hypothetical protein